MREEDDLEMEESPAVGNWTSRTRVVKVQASIVRLVRAAITKFFPVDS